MANKILKKYIGADQVGATQLLIEKNAAVRGIDSTDTEVNLIKLNTNDEVLLKGIKILDQNGLVPPAVLPSYVDDVLEYADLASFPATGETGKIYVALDTNKTYRWSGSAYIYITSGAVDSVNSQTGVVVLNTDDIGEGATNKYYSSTLFDADLATKDTDDLAEGTTNLYFTDARAQAAAVEDQIVDGVTNKAPSQNAVHDALALKQANVVWVKQSFDLTSTDISNGYIDLSHEALANSVVAFVDRLAIHQGSDYTVSVVSGVTRLTFAGDLVTPGQGQLDANDNIYVTFMRLA